jgi:LCP family protein required for cell wall assembly
MRPPGDDQPPEQPEDDDQPGKAEEPEYTVYGRGGESRKAKPPKGKKAKEEEPAEGRGETEEEPKPEEPEASDEQAEPPAEEPEQAPEPPAEKPKAPAGKPEYTVYKSRPGLRDRFRRPDMQSLRRERRGPGGGYRDRLRALVGGGGGGRRWLRWLLIAAGVWLLISFLSFAISAQLQKSELPDSAKDALSPAPPLLGANILILGGDRRGEAQANATGIEAQGPPRADSIMVVHAALGSFRKLSIPRDAFAEIPGCGQQKINASLACNTQSEEGNPGLTIETVEGFLGIDINHIVIVDFDGFADFIDTLGGVEVEVPNNKNVSGACRLKNRTLVVAGDVDGGKGGGGVSIGLTAGEHTLEGQKALAFARLRHNVCDPSENDIDRAERQQLVLNGIKGRLTSVTRAPYNFIKGPWIGWNAPKAIISDMGGLNLPQLAMTSFFGGGETRVLEPNLDGPGGSLLIPKDECEKEVEKLLGKPPPNDPICSPGG